MSDFEFISFLDWASTGNSIGLTSSGETEPWKWAMIREIIDEILNTKIITPRQEVTILSYISRGDFDNQDLDAMEDLIYAISNKEVNSFSTRLIFQEIYRVAEQ